MSYKITPEHHNFDRALSIVNIVGRKVLYWTFMKGCPRKSLNQSLRDYLKGENWSNAEIRNVFDKTMRSNIDNDPSGSTFDISLLFVVIKKCCEKVLEVNFKIDDSMEGLARQVKDYRNGLFHGKPELSELEAKEKIENCKDVYDRLIDEVKGRYSLLANDVDTYRSEIMKEIAAYVNHARSDDEVLLSLEKGFKEHVLFGTEELKTFYTEWSKVVPLFFLDGFDNFEVEIDVVFTEIIMNDAGRFNTTERSERCESIIINRKEKLILVEGQAGSGKTTLLKFILSSWVKVNSGEIKITDLEKYELLVFFECRNTSISTLRDLISDLIPNTVKKYGMVDSMKILRSLNVLFLIDGFDEFNKNSVKVVKEILYFSQKSNFLTICTSRPSRLHDFYKMKPSNVKLKHLRIDGVPPDLHKMFVERLHKNLDPENKTDTAKLVQYIENAPITVKGHFIFPLNLTMITFLWIISSEKVNGLTTISSLYIEIFDLLTEKLVDRLKNNLKYIEYSVDELKAALKCAYQEICGISFQSLIKKAYVIDIKEFELISRFCKNIEVEGTKIILPVNEIMGAYLSAKHSWTGLHSITHYSYPHRSFQEHMSSEYVCELIKSLEDSGSTCDLNDVLPKGMKYERTDFFKHLIGLMASIGRDFLRHHGVFLVDNLKEQNLGRNTSEYWFDFLAEAQNDECIVKACSGAISSYHWKIEDRHVSSASVLLKQTKVIPNRFFLKLVDDASYNYHNLKSLIESISKTGREVECNFNHNYWFPSFGSSDVFAKCLFNGSCRVTEFRGHLNQESSFHLLPSSIKNIGIAVSTPECLSPLLSRLPKLELNNLEVKILAGLPLNFMKPLPNLRSGTTIEFLEITDKNIKWLVNALILLNPPDSGFSSVNIYGVNEKGARIEKFIDGLTFEGYKYLLEYIEQAMLGNFNTISTHEGEEASDDFMDNSSMTQNTGMCGGCVPLEQFNSKLMNRTVSPSVEQKQKLLVGSYYIFSPRLTEEDIRVLQTLQTKVDHYPNGRFIEHN